MSAVTDGTSQRCFHCHQDVPVGFDATVTIDGAEQPMCCYGCHAVASTIVQQGLTHFYRYRQLDDNGLPIDLVPDSLSKVKAEAEVYDRADVQQEFVLDGDSKQVTLAVEGMTCAACAWLIERRLEKLTGITKVAVNSTTDRLLVRWQAPALLSEILVAIHQVGYRATPFQHADVEDRVNQQKRSYIKRLGVAGIASMQTMMVAFGLYFDDIDDMHRLYFWWVSLLFTAPVIVYSCQPFFVNAWHAIKARNINMDVPISLAMLLMFGASFYATLTDTGEVYYECVSMFAFFLLTGRYLEVVAKHQAIANAANLMKLIPATVERWQDDRYESVMLKAVSAGDRLLVKPGATIPVDGKLLSAQAWCDEALLTGESRPVAKQRHDALFAGAINQTTAIEIEVTAVHQKTLLASIVALQDEAISHKPKFAHFADRVGRYFIASTMLLALFTYIAWYFLSPTDAFWVMLAVLVATCPCALALAAPTAMSNAISQLNRAGILVKNADIIERLPQVRQVAVDKTGTLTQGQFSLVNQWCRLPDSDHQFNENQIVDAAAGLELHSEHPLAHPVKQLSATPEHFAQVENHPGQGLSARNESGVWRIGQANFALADPTTAASLPFTPNVVLSLDGTLLGAWRFDDQLRGDAAITMDWLRNRRLPVTLLTGDSWSRAEEIANTLAINQMHAELSPSDKLAQLRQLQQRGPTLMIGDGINDGPVLGQADVSVTFASGTQLAQAGSDVVIINGRLSAIMTMYKIAGRTRGIVRQNFGWALGYNALILPLAVTGQVGPLLAMLGMSVSSLIVMANSLRLMKRIS